MSPLNPMTTTASPLTPPLALALMPRTLFSQQSQIWPLKARLSLRLVSLAHGGMAALTALMAASKLASMPVSPLTHFGVKVLGSQAQLLLDA